jgi:NADPH-dependent curcumin reductase CurA
MIAARGDTSTAHIQFTPRCGTDEMRALRRLAEWQLAGKIRFKEDVLDGIELMPEALFPTVA